MKIIQALIKAGRKEVVLVFPPSLSPVLPPFVPSLRAEDDTSNFEDQEQPPPRPLAAQRNPPPAGFQGQDLPFLGWFFSKALTTLAKSE